MWYNHLLVVQHFRIFGSQCYALILKQQRNKLSERSKKCIILEYSMNSKAYRLYNEENKNFILSRDVFFLEFDKDILTVDRKLNYLEKFVPRSFIRNQIIFLHILKGGFPS